MLHATFRSGWLLVLTTLVPVAVHAIEFDYSQIADAVERCEGRLIVPAKRAPIVDETLREYISRLTDLRGESSFYLNVSQLDPDSPFARVMARKFDRSADLRELTAAGLMLSRGHGQLDILNFPVGTLAQRIELREPIWRVQYHADGPGSGYVSLIGWSRVRHFRYVDQKVTAVDHLPAPFTVDDGRDLPEQGHLRTHALRPASPSLLLEAMGELAERLVAHVDADGLGPIPRLPHDEYPSALLAMAAYALRTDPVMRNLIAGAINEHVHGRLQFEAVFDVDRVFVIRSADHPDRPLDFRVPADPWRDAEGWGRLR